MEYHGWPWAPYYNKFGVKDMDKRLVMLLYRLQNLACHGKEKCEDLCPTGNICSDVKKSLNIAFGTEY